MKEVKHYICDICHTEYNSKCQCQQCEKSHKKSMRIIREHYISQTQKLSRKAGLNERNIIPCKADR